MTKLARTSPGEAQDCDLPVAESDPAGLPAGPAASGRLSEKPPSTAPEWQKRAWWRQEFREGFRQEAAGRR
ncbi:MAG: hypothetical protein P8Z68_11600 [Kineosporiaceae bacterium]|jgi:hypothetical protein